MDKGDIGDITTHVLGAQTLEEAVGAFGFSRNGPSWNIPPQNEAMAAQEVAEYWHVVNQNPGRYDAFVLRVKSLCRNKPVESVLDIGCGCGASTVQLAEAFPYATVRGIDISQDMLNFAARLKEEAHRTLASRLEFKCESIHKPSAKKFDVLVSRHVFHRLKRLDQVGWNLVRRANPGCVIYVSSFFWDGSPEAEAALLENLKARTSPATVNFARSYAAAVLGAPSRKTFLDWVTTFEDRHEPRSSEVMFDHPYEASFAARL